MSNQKHRKVRCTVYWNIALEYVRRCWCWWYDGEKKERAEKRLSIAFNRYEMIWMDGPSECVLWMLAGCCLLPVCDCLFIQHIQHQITCAHIEWTKANERERIEIFNELWWWCYTMALIVIRCYGSVPLWTMLTIVNACFTFNKLIE